MAPRNNLPCAVLSMKWEEKKAQKEMLGYSVLAAMDGYDKKTNLIILILQILFKAKSVFMKPGRTNHINSILMQIKSS